MAGKGGGSWKVAYADFVTAMMAFFMVMWIGSQDQKTRQAVANYFVDPSGASKKPSKTGAVFESLSGGPVPDQEKTATGRGRNSYSPGQPNWATRMVGEYVMTDPKAGPYWREQAERAKRAAADSPQVRANQKPLDEVAVKLLSRQLKEELTAAAPTSAGLYEDLLHRGIQEVSWDELAEDMVRNKRD
jgi:flagellar motor protein MotB